MASKLPNIGVRAIVENHDGYMKSLDSMNKATEKASKSIQSATSQTSAVGKVMSSVADKVGGLAGKFNDLAQQATAGKAELGSLFGSLPTGAAAITAVAAAAVAAGAAIIALGVRGAGLVGIAQSFDRLTQAVGQTSAAMLGRMRQAAAGTISDFELMQKTNFALAGTTGAFGQAFGSALPRLLEIARVQARATGQDINYMLDSIVTGIKRGSPLILDNLGFTIKISEANAAMAASLGKTVEQLTAEEKQIAVLNALLAAGETSMATYAGVNETAAEKISRMNATITNMLDALAIGVQPAFGMFLDVINRALAFVSMLVTAINPLISAFLEMAAAIVTGPIQALFAVLDPIGKLISWLLTLVTVIVRPVLNAIRTLGTTIGTAFQRIVQFIGELIGQNLGINFENLALNLGRGAGYAFGAFATGIMAAANALIFPAIIEIATFIADFLVGQSPPPKGPLSQIDKGGANVMGAWMEGFAGVGLQPVEEVAANVNAALGAIGQMTLPAVKARIAQLDAALLPFSDQLNIVKANFEAISEPAKAALDAIDRQMAKAVQALAKGEAGSAEAVRALDAQRAKIEAALDSQQGLVDQAQIQMALAKAQQSEERALLSIQEARLNAQEKMANATDEVAKATKQAAEAAKTQTSGGGAGAVEAQPVSGGGAGAFDMSMPSVADMISGSGAVDQMQADLSQGFQEGLTVGLTNGTTAAFAANQQALNTQVARIGQANIGERIASAFTGIGTSIQGALNDASTIITDWIGGITDPSREGSIPYSFNALVSGDWTTLTASLTAPFDDFVTGVGEIVSGFITTLTDPASTTGILGGIASLAGLLPTQFATLITAFTDNFDLIAEVITGFLDSALNPDTVGSITWEFEQLPTRITNAIRSVGDVFNEQVVTPISDAIASIGQGLFHFFAESGEGTLKGYIDAGVAWFTELPTRITEALSVLGNVFLAVIVSPMIAGLNEAITGVETFINNALSGLGTLIGSLQGLADAIGFGSQLAEIQGSLAGGINLPRISAPTIAGAYRGGSFSSGLLRVGEKGEELISSSRKLSVFPNDVTKALVSLSDILAQPMPMELAGAGGGNTSYDNSTYNNQFVANYPASAGSFMQQVATFNAMRGGRR